jgi:hypothetical protein
VGVRSDGEEDGEVGWWKWPRSMVLGPWECAQPGLCGTVAHDCMVTRVAAVSPSEIHYKVGDLFSSAASLELQNAADGSTICFSSPFNLTGIGYTEGRRGGGGDSIQAGSTFQRTRVSGWGWRGEGGYVFIKTGPAPKGGKRWTGTQAELLEAEVGLKGILIAGFVLVQAGESGARAVDAWVGGWALLLSFLVRL